MWIIFVLFLTSNTVFSLKCTFSKVDDMNCLCSVTTDKKTYLPILEANCKNLELEDFPRFEDLIYEINYLDLSLNSITILDFIYKEKIFQDLQFLILNHNNIQYIGDEFFWATPNLMHLDLSFNNISNLESPDIFLDAANLSYLDLSYNAIKKLPDKLFKPLVSLEFLLLTQNPLKEMLSEKNSLEDKFGLTLKVKHLFLEAVGLDDFHVAYFENFTKLESVSLADNALTQIPNFSKTLSYLDISGTHISQIKARSLIYEELKTLNLNRLRNLQSIENYAFLSLPKLEQLTITDCPKLTTLNSSLFGNLDKSTNLALKNIVLARNGLNSLNASFQYLFDKVDFFDISHNPWDCDCGLLWLREFDKIITKGSLTRCLTPYSLAHKEVTKVEEEDVPLCFPGRYRQTGNKLLLAGLVLVSCFLIAAVLYLCYYVPDWSKLKTSIVSPSSPYAAANRQTSSDEF